MQQSTFVRHESCPKCGSKDNLGRYSDGHASCFTPGCGYYEHGDGTVTEIVQKRKSLEMTGVAGPIPDRKISQATVEKYGVTLEYGADGKISKHHYPYVDKDTGETIGTKVRIVKGKDFYVTGNLAGAGLFGQHLFAEGGKAITIVEGEADALAISEMFNNQWPVVSIKSGAKSAAKDVKNSLEYLETFETVVICFDQDKAGKDAAGEVVDLFSPNKVKVCSLPLKDAGEMLKAGRIQEFTKAWWNSKVYRPDGIVNGSDTWQEIIEEVQVDSIPYPWECMNGLTYGFRAGELVTITSGSGMGKSQIVRELQHYLLSATKDNVGVLALEESVKRSGLGIMSIEANRPLHLPDCDATMEEKKRYWEATLGSGRYFFYDHFGSTSEDNLLSRVRYLAKGLDCKWIILDHLSIVVSDQEVSDERKAIDAIMTKLRQMVQETGVGLFLVSHLRRPVGKAHEDGGQISLAELRGSASIAQLSDMVIGLERNQQHEDAEVRNTTTVRILKNRFAGLTGPACYLYYDKDTGRMIETSNPETREDDDEEEF